MSSKAKSVKKKGSSKEKGGGKEEKLNKKEKSDSGKKEKSGNDKDKKTKKGKKKKKKDDDVKENDEPAEPQESFTEKVKKAYAVVKPFICCCCGGGNERKKYFQPYVRPHQADKDTTTFTTDLQKLNEQEENVKQAKRDRNRNRAAAFIQRNYRGHYHRMKTHEMWQIAM